MKKFKSILMSLAICALILSCEKSDIIANEGLTQQSTDCILDLMLKASTDTTIVRSMNNEAITSHKAGLEESVYLEDVINNDGTIVRSGASSSILKEYIVNNLTTYSTRSDEDVTMVVNDVEIYWPYCDNWDGYSQPVIVINEYNESQFIEDDKVYAYKYINNGIDCEIEEIIVDEEYAKHNPVWVISKSDVTLEYITYLKTKKYNASQNITRATGSEQIYEVTATKLTSTEQHDSWLDGGSEYVIYWFHPDVNKNDSLRVNISGQIKLSRKEITNATPKDVSFICNFDWATDQRYNRLKIIEFDPGSNMTFPITLKFTTSENKEVTLGTEITINENDEHIMEYEIPRQSMFSSATYVNDSLYRRDFTCLGVTLEVETTNYDNLENNNN